MKFLYLYCLFVLFALVESKAPFQVGGNAKDIIPNQYIVVFKEGSTSAQREEQKDHVRRDGTFISSFDLPNFSGFAANMDNNLLERIRNSDAVAYIEADQMMTATQCQTQNSATWGIDRIDTSPFTLSGSYVYSRTGNGVDAYIVDTGILITHQDFGGRAIWGSNFVGDGKNTDCNGHGTHVAGTVGSTTYGVAKGVTLIAVKVLGCTGSGSNSGVISGINWVVQQAASRKKPSVINMSLGGGASSSLDSAITAAVNANITVVVAAGNDNLDACNYSPARVPAALTVGSTGKPNNKDTRSSFSNYGSCVDIFGPGESITSTWYTSTTATNVLSGTSMATPHATGVSALVLSQFPGYTPSQVMQTVISRSTSGIITLNCRATGTCKNSPNKMLCNVCN